MFGPSLCDQAVNPGMNLPGSTSPVDRDRHRLHVLVVIVLQPAVIVMVIVPVVMIVS